MSKKKVTDFIGFPLLLNLNSIMRLSTLDDYQAELEKLEQSNPLLTLSEEKPKIEALAVDKSKEVVEKVKDYVESQGDFVNDDKEVVKKAKSFVKQKEQQEKAAELLKKHSEKMKAIKAKSKKAMNPNFFANARQKADPQKGVAFDVAPIKDSVATQSIQKVNEMIDKKEEEKQPTVSMTKYNLEQLMAIIDEQKIEYKKEGEYVYELYAILIHAGSSYFGHYYTYVKDMATNKWLCFNDTNVSDIRVSDIKKTYGEIKKSTIITRTVKCWHRIHADV